jgi:hypothetical protein
MVNHESSPIREKSALERRVAMGLSGPDEDAPRTNTEVDVEQFMVDDDDDLGSEDE